MEKILNAIGRVWAKLPKIGMTACYIVALLCVFVAFGSEKWHCLFTAAMYLGLAYLIKHAKD